MRIGRGRVVDNDNAEEEQGRLNFEGYARGDAGRLYWISDSEPPKNIAKSFYFNIDNVPARPRRTWSTTVSTRISGR